MVFCDPGWKYAPGVRVAKARGFRIAPPWVCEKFRGKELIVSREMVVLCSALSVLSNGAAAFTEIDSLVAPTCKATSTRIACATCTRIPFWTELLNPAAPTVISYRPTCR